MEKPESRVGLFAEAHLAFVFLTRLPLPRLSDAAARAPLSAAAWAFPLVGLAVAGLATLALWGADALGVAPTASALVGLAVTAWLTGALHEDGLADTADGFGGGHDRERKLAIMRDSRIGSYGVLALLVSLGLRWTALVTLLEAAGPLAAGAAFMAVSALSRVGIVLGMVFLGPARPDGLGATAGAPGALPVGGALLVAAAASWLLLPGFTLAPLFALALIGVLATCWLANRQVGGHTGDVLGTVEQVVSAIGLTTLATLLGGSA